MVVDIDHAGRGFKHPAHVPGDLDLAVVFRSINLSDQTDCTGGPGGTSTTFTFAR